MQEKSTSNLFILRQKAQSLIEKNLLNTGSQFSESELLKILHELELHEIELEMQNEELRKAKEQIQFEAIKYSQIYDSAPSGYFTLSQEGIIIELNLSGSEMLGKDRTALKNSRLGFFISEGSRPVFNHFLSRVFLSRNKETCEVTISVNGKTPAFIYLTGIVSQNPDQCIVTMIDITERIQSEKILFESEKRHQAILQTAMDGYWHTDQQGRLLEVNETYCRMSGYTKEELLTMRISDLEAIDSAQDIDERIGKIISMGNDRFESQHRRKDGSTFDVEVHAQFINIDGGKFSSFFHDITNRKQAEKAINESEEKFRHLVGDMLVGVLLQGPNAEILLSNPKALELLDLTEDQLLGKTSFDPQWNVIHEDGSPFPGSTHPVPQAISTRQSVREVVMGVYRPTLKDRVWLLVYAEPQLNDDGTVRQVVCTFIDITERKQAEQALRENERLLRESQNAAHIGSYSLDLISRTWKASPEMYEIFGIDKSFPNTLDKWVQCIADDQREKISQNLFDAVSEGKRSDQEYKIVRFIDNIERWVHGVGEMEFDSQGSTVRIVGTIQDITNRKQAEEELKRINEELEYRVNERTAELLKSNTALRYTEEKYRTVADFTYDWEYWINSEGRYNYISPSCERITGYTPEEFFTIEALMEKIIFKADRAIWKNHISVESNQNQEKINQEINFRIVTKSGCVRWIDHSCRRLYKDGKYMGIRASNRDITEKINAENELLNVTIEVEERERNRFSRELHDGLGPLLSTIKLYFQWLSETNNADIVKIITEKGNKNIDMAIQTTREVALGLSSLVLNNSGYIDTTLNFTQSINELHKITIDFIFNSRQRFSYLLEITLYRLTTELISNTLKYAEATRVEIIYNFIKGKKLILFSYSDNGIGFDLANIEKTSKGLGLMNIQHRLKIIGGNMRIETEVGKGIKVYIELPVNEPLIKMSLKTSKNL